MPFAWHAAGTPPAEDPKICVEWPQEGQWKSDIFWTMPRIYTRHESN